MSDNNIIKTYISILNEILAMELTSIRLEAEDEEELNEIERGDEIWNNKFDLDNINFVLFLRKLEDKKMLKINFYYTLKPSEEREGDFDFFYGQEMYKGDWTSVNYGDVNKDLIIKYRDELKSIDTQGDNINIIDKPIKIKNDLIVGPFSYKNGLIYHNESLIERLDPQMRKLCYLFFIRKNEFLSYETIQNELSDSGYVTKENMQKVVSKVRTILKSKIKKDIIDNINGKGYIFNAKKIA
jgi:DNA-binding winged helix-turn-helix (wHTH) protein